MEEKKNNVVKIVIGVVVIALIIVICVATNNQMQKAEAEKRVEEARKELNETLSTIKPFDNSNELVENKQNIDNNVDTENIANAEYIEKLRKEQKLTCKSAKILVQDTQYKSLYPDMLTAKVVNNSKETVKSYKVVFLAYDNNYLPVKIKGKWNSSGEYSHIGTDDEANLVAGATTKDNFGWELDKSHGITYVIACIQEAEFFNGEKWENQYLQYWLEKYEGKILPEDSRKGLIPYKNV